MRDLIKQLEEYRLENRISQEKLAEMLGVAFVTVNRWFNRHQIQTYQIKKLLAGKGRKK